ncbi:cytochrome P450 [Streptomyces sp. NPDC001941]|uniref:cytochrome P450 n=1 Tax=Streptomyces sp. NPDC001941 TaxID=3154659 RepID=UPI003327B146
MTTHKGPTAIPRADAPHRAAPPPATARQGRPRRPWPFLGDLPALLRDPYGFLDELPRHGAAVPVRLGPTPAVVLCTPELTHRVLTDDTVFAKGGPFIDRVRDLVGESVTTSDRPRHRRVRRMMQPAFRPDHLHTYARAVVEETGRRLDDGWLAGQAEVYPAMQELTTRIAVRTMFARGLPLSDVDRVCDVIAAILHGSDTRLLLPSPLARIPTPGKHHFDRARTELRAITDRLIRDNATEASDDMLSVLLDARDADDQGFTPEELSNEILTLFLGGVETVASTLAWSLSLLTQDPATLHAVRTEIATVLQGRPPTLDDLARMPLLKGTVLEALRLHPPGWLLTRLTTESTELGRLRVPPGTTVIYSPYLLHRLPAHYPDAHRFIPQRWSSGFKPPRGAFVPFGGGARLCVGDNLTLLEAPLVLASILSTRTIAPDPTSPLPPRRLRFLHTPGRLRIRVGTP